MSVVDFSNLHFGGKRTVQGNTKNNVLDGIERMAALWKIKRLWAS